LFFIHPEHNTRSGWFRDMTIELFVGDKDGRNWEGPISVIPENQLGDFAGEEFDWAELENGDLLCVLRAETMPTFDTQDPGQDRRVTRMVKSGDTWEPTRVEMAPFPPSGHPDLLRTREGVIFHFATKGISWTADDGKTWADLEIPAWALKSVRYNREMKYRWYAPGSAYYPRSVQMANGEVLCVGHDGSDDPYAQGDQSIVGLRFFVEA